MIILTVTCGQVAQRYFQRFKPVTFRFRHFESSSCRLFFLFFTSVRCTMCRNSTWERHLGFATANMRANLALSSHLSAASVSKPAPEASGLPKQLPIQVLVWPNAAPLQCWNVNRFSNMTRPLAFDAITVQMKARIGPHGKLDCVHL